MPTSDLRARLQRLRAHKHRLPPSVPPAELQRRAPRGAALPGYEMVTPLGAFQLIETRYAPDFIHGPLRLADWLAGDPATAARLVRDESLAVVDLQALAFIDIETTGLAGGTGTLAFLVGVGLWMKDEFVLRQYFLRDPGEEEALLTALVDDLVPCVGWITFNGRAFDLPILATRLTLNRQRGALDGRLHLDLLAPARRLYRGRLPGCSLGQLEQDVLHIVRDQADVSGALIPQMYLDYLRTGDAADMQRVIYHNAIDILSMVTLGAHLLDVFSLSVQASEVRSQKSEVIQNRAPEVVLRLANWHEDNARWVEAEAAYHQALAGHLSLDDRRLGLTRLAALLKRQDRRAEAAPLWEQLAAFTLDDVEPFVELAKLCEWHTLDLPSAEAWTARALKVAATWPRGWQRTTVEEELRHRLERLKKKLAG